MAERAGRWSFGKSGGEEGEAEEQRYTYTHNSSATVQKTTRTSYRGAVFAPVLRAPCAPSTEQGREKITSGLGTYSFLRTPSLTR